MPLRSFGLRSTVRWLSCLALSAFAAGCGDQADPEQAGGAAGTGALSGGSAGAGATGGAGQSGGQGGSQSSSGGSSGSGGSISAGGGAGGNAGTTTGGSGNAGTANGGSANGGSGAGGSEAGSSGSGSGGAGAGGGMGGASGSGAAGAGSGGAPEPADWPLVNGVQWADTEGNPIQAHGGGILKVGEDYYWFGENRNPDGTFYAVSAYRSRDLVRWEFVSHVLRETSGAGLDPANVERPKVVFNESTGKYVMWMHWENGSDYGEARAAVASSDTVTGDYTYHGSFRPLADSGVMDHGKPGYMSRDCTLFVDDDGTGYFISASNENYDLNLYELTPDYLQIERLVDVLFPGGHREAPALFKRNGVYFLLTSGATGWSPNQAQYATSSSIGSGWSSMTNVGDGNTFYSQSTYVLPIEGSSGTSYLYLGDRWAGAWSGRVNDSMYVWQPITFGSATSMSMSWNNTLSFDAGAGSVTGTTNTFQLVNVKSGKALEVEDGSTEDGAPVVQNAPSDAEQQTWSLNYNAAGYFRVTNALSQKILDVPDESNDDGVVLKQWEDHNGDNQVWLVVDVGAGRFKLENKKSGKFVAVIDGSTADGAGIEQRTGTDGEEQQFRLVPR